MFAQGQNQHLYGPRYRPNYYVSIWMILAIVLTNMGYYYIIHNNDDNDDNDNNKMC